MTTSRTKSWLSLAVIGSALVFGASAALARVDVGIGIGIPPLVFAPAPYYAAPPPMVYAPPPVAYAAPAYGYGYPGVTVGVGGGFWANDRYGHRHWHRR
jgi:hypothetical protein